MAEDGIHSIIRHNISTTLDLPPNSLMGPITAIVTTTIAMGTHLLAGNHLRLEWVILLVGLLHLLLTHITESITLIPTLGENRVRQGTPNVVVDQLLQRILTDVVATNTGVGDIRTRGMASEWAS